VSGKVMIIKIKGSGDGVIVLKEVDLRIKLD
jgi:hypothetical protein